MSAKARVGRIGINLLRAFLGAPVYTGAPFFIEKAVYFMLKKIPKEAKKVAVILKRDVKRPLKKSIVRNPKNDALMAIQFGPKKIPIALLKDDHCCCPMGLHPLSLSSWPLTPTTFRATKNRKAISAFYGWWDDISTKKDAWEAIKMIWGP